MANYLGGHSLPYSAPLDFNVIFNTCGFFSGRGNYAIGEVHHGGQIVSSKYFPYKEVFQEAYSKVCVMAQFLSNTLLDELTEEEFDYLYNSQEYSFAANRFPLSDYEFRKSWQSYSLIREISPYNNVVLMDTHDGLMTGTPRKEYYEERVTFDKVNSKINILYKIPKESTRYSKSIQTRPYFLKCYFFAVKFNILCEIVKNSAYWHLTSGKFCANGNSVNPFIDYYDKKYLNSLGYANIH